MLKITPIIKYFKKQLFKSHIFFKKNPFLLTIFFLSCFYFIYQHLITISWDFSAHVMNAKYLFYEGDYFELYRAPLTYILLSPLLIFKMMGEIMYVILISILFLYANIKLSDALFNTNKKILKENMRFIFYFFSLSGFVIVYGFSTGSELLNLSFIELFLAFLISGRTSGHFLSLAFLSRYNSLIFLPLIIFYKEPKKIIKNLLLFLMVIFPWFLYNFLFHDNWFASFIDSYTLNIHLRNHLFQNFSFSMLLPLVDWLFILFIIGIVYSLFILINKLKNKIDKYKIILIYVFGLLTLYEFSQIPFKFYRYLFNLSLVVAFFSSLGSIFILKKFYKLKKAFLLFLFISFIVTFGIMITLLIVSDHHNPPFRSAAEDIKNLNISGCEVLSPHWAPLNYLTGTVRPLGRNDINESINLNKVVLIFIENPTTDDLFDLKSISNYPSLIERNKYIILGKQELSNENCFKVTPYNQRFSEDPCKILGEKMSELKLGNFSEKICNIIN